MLTKSILEWSIFTNNVSEIKIMLVVFSLILILFITHHINNERLIDLLYGDQLMSTRIARLFIFIHMILIGYLTYRLYELT